MANIIVLVGYEGSGKTSTAQYIKGKNPSYEILSTDIHLLEHLLSSDKIKAGRRYIVDSARDVKQVNRLKSQFGKENVKSLAILADDRTRKERLDGRYAISVSDPKVVNSIKETIDKSDVRVENNFWHLNLLYRNLDKELRDLGL
jgi:dephospho-CoA kinase